MAFVQKSKQLGSHKLVRQFSTQIINDQKVALV